MKLRELRPRFIELSPVNSRGWDDLWAAFVTVIREELDELDVLYDNVSVEIVPAHPPHSAYDGAVLSRRIGLPGKGASNEFEAAFVVSAEWEGVGEGLDLTEFFGSGPSTYEHDPAPRVDEFIAEVEQSEVVARLRSADDAFRRWQVVYQPPEERD